MLRRIGVLFALLLLTQALGCALCASPDDYMGPVPADGLGFMDRVGSILQYSAAPPGAVTEEIINDSQGEAISPGNLEQLEAPPTPEPGQGSMRPMLGPDSRRILPQQMR